MLKPRTKLPPIKLAQRESNSEKLSKLLKPKKDFFQSDDNVESVHGDINKLFQSLHSRHSDLVSQFTEDYRDTIREIRQTDKINPNLLHAATKNLKDVMENAGKKIAPLMPDPSMERIEIEESQVSSLSSGGTNLWNLLETHCENSKGFYITPENFNAYALRQPHWLEKPPVEWEVVNKSIVKCQNWLQNIKI